MKSARHWLGELDVVLSDHAKCESVIAAAQRDARDSALRAAKEACESVAEASDEDIETAKDADDYAAALSAEARSTGAAWCAETIGHMLSKALPQPNVPLGNNPVVKP